MPATLIGPARTLLGTGSFDPSALPDLAAEYLFSEGTGQITANRRSAGAGAGQDGTNYLKWPEHRLARDWSLTGATVTDDAAADPVYGRTAASRVVFTAVANRSVGQTVTVPAGAMTISVWVKSNDGTTQKVRLWLKGATSSDLTVTTTWARVSFTQTLTAGSGSCGLLNDAAGEANDVLVWGFQMEPGSSATDFPAHGLDLYLGGSSATNQDPAWSSGGVDLNGSVYLGGVSSAPIPLPQATVYAVVKVTGTQLSNGFSVICNQTYRTPRTDVLLGLSVFGDGPVFTYGGTSATTLLTFPTDGLWYVLAGVYDGARVAVYCGDRLLTSVAASGLTTTTLTSLVVGGVGYDSLGVTNFPGEIAYLSFYNTGHADARIKQIARALVPKVAARVSVVLLTRQVVYEGDSITAAASNYVLLCQKALTPRPQGTNVSVGGSTVASANGRATTVDGLYAATLARNVLHVLLGANDMATDSAATFVANLKAYCLARRAAGYKIVVGTVLPRTLAGFNATRNTANGLIAADPSFYDALSDFAADATMGPDAAASDVSLYGDGLHPTTLGHTYLKPIAQAALASVLA